MKYPQLSTRIYGAPLLLHPDKAAVIERVFQSHALGVRDVALADQNGESPQALAAAMQERRIATYAGLALQRRDDKPYAITQSGIALIPVMGTLVQRSGGLDALSGMQSYGEIQTLVDRALNDPDVRGMVLEIDSPGGESAGLFELAASLASTQRAKPLWSVANEQAFSAAYAIAAATDQFYLPRTALTGSVGTIALHVDQSRQDVMRGLHYTAIHAGAQKNDFTSHAPLSDRALATLTNMVESVNDVFVGHVVQCRELTEQAVRDMQAGIYTAQDAVDVGLADGVRTLNETVSALEQYLAAKQFSPGTRTARQSSAAKPKESIMQKASEDAAATTLSAEQQEAKIKAAFDDGHKAGAAAERVRLQGILACEEAKGRGTMAQHIGYSTDMTVEDAKKMLASAPVESAAPANAFAAAMAQIKNPHVGAGGEIESAAAQPVIDRHAIFAQRRAQIGAKQ